MAPTSSASRRACSSSTPTSIESCRETPKRINRETRKSRLLGTAMPRSAEARWSNAGKMEITAATPATTTHRNAYF